MTVCRFWRQGNCRKGNSCTFEHPNNQQNHQQNRYQPLSNQQNNEQHQGGDSYRPDHRNTPSRHVGIDVETIKIDLTDDRPTWPFSVYGPGKNAAKQLLEGAIEQSFEEVRYSYWIMNQSGNPHEAQLNEVKEYSKVQEQVEKILGDLHGAVRYVLDGEKAHPNRIDLCSENRSLRPWYNYQEKRNPFGTSSTLRDSSGMLANPQATFGAPAFGQQSAPQGGGFGKPAFGQATGFGNPSPLGQGSAFGRPSAMGQAPAFGQPSMSNSGGSPFGQAANSGSSPFGQAPAPAAPAFGQPSAPNGGGGFGQPAFGQPSQSGGFGQTSTVPSGSPFAQKPAFGQPAVTAQTSPFGKPAFGSPSAPFNNNQQQQPSGFGQPSQNTQNPFGAAPAPFGTPAQAAQPANSSPFGRPVQPVQPNTQSPFGNAGVPVQPVSNPFGQAAFNQGAQQMTNGVAGHTMNGPAQIERGHDNKIQRYNGKPVKYIEDIPYYLRNPSDPNSLERIWFPDGPPPYKDGTEANPEAYQTAVAEAYKFAIMNGTFKDGFMPEMPPKMDMNDWNL